MNESRLIFMARPGPRVLSTLEEALAGSGLDSTLGGAKFHPGSWHQSLSNRHQDDPDRRMRMLRAGARVQAPAFDLVLNRISSQGDASDSIHWSFRARGASPSGLASLMASLRAELQGEGIDDKGGHSPHLTISYRAPVRFAGSLPVAPIAWRIDAFELVQGGGKPYRYRTIGKWPLLAGPEAEQLGLFTA